MTVEAGRDHATTFPAWFARIRRALEPIITPDASRTLREIFISSLEATMQSRERDVTFQAFREAARLVEPKAGEDKPAEVIRERRLLWAMLNARADQDIR